MDKSHTNLILLIAIFIIVIMFLHNYFIQNNNCVEKFNTLVSKNTPTNAFNVADNLEYGMPDMKPISNDPNELQGPSSVNGVNQNNNSDVFDDRGYKWTKSVNNSDVDVFTNIVDDIQLRNNFERTYMLDPTGDVAKYDISNSPISINCCPAQYSPPFKVTENDESNCDYAQQYVANQYSGMNYKNGYGCACMTPEQAHYYGSRGGNST